jgi:hypothetical protein
MYDLVSHDPYMKLRRPPEYTTLDLIGFGFLELALQLNRIEHKLDRLLQGEQNIMAAQDDINTAITQLGLDQTALNDAAARILAEIANLQSAGVDTTGLVAAVDALNTAVGPVVDIVPPPAP